MQCPVGWLIDCFETRSGFVTTLAQSWWRSCPSAQIAGVHCTHTCSAVLLFLPVVWGECNHSFHNCCMSLWVKQNNRCPLCQQDWVVQRIGKWERGERRLSWCVCNPGWSCCQVTGQKLDHSSGLCLQIERMMKSFETRPGHGLPFCHF